MLIGLPPVLLPPSPPLPQAERMSTMNLLALARFLFYALLGLSVPQSLLYLSVFLPYSR